MRTSVLFALAAALAAAQEMPPMSFDCSDSLQDICEHQCWGAYCQNPVIGATLNYDAPSASVEARRRRGAGCLPSPNRCSTKSGYASGHNCDEFPFASTSQADDGGQTNQCVISSHNSHQGGIIASYTRDECGGDPCQFTMAFGNADDIQYCQAASGDQSVCQNNGDIYGGASGAEYPDPSGASKRAEREPLGVRFLTESGMTIILPPRFEVGQLTRKAVPTNATMKALADITNEGAELVQWTFVDDYIVKRLD